MYLGFRLRDFCRYFMVGLWLVAWLLGCLVGWTVETGSCCVAQSGFKFMILLPQYWDYRYVPPTLALTHFFQFYFRTRNSLSCPWKIFKKCGCFLSPNFQGNQTTIWFQFSNGHASVRNCSDLSSELFGTSAGAQSQRPAVVFNNLFCVNSVFSKSRGVQIKFTWSFSKHLPLMVEIMTGLSMTSALNPFRLRVLPTKPQWSFWIPYAQVPSFAGRSKVLPTTSSQTELSLKSRCLGLCRHSLSLLLFIIHFSSPGLDNCFYFNLSGLINPKLDTVSIQSSGGNGWEFWTSALHNVGKVWAIECRGWTRQHGWWEERMHKQNRSVHQTETNKL